MEETELQKKLDEMQIYLPFLEKVIKKLRHSSCEKSDNLKQVQLHKLEVLSGLLRNEKKKLNLDTLLKCENVLKKLHKKFEKDENYDKIILEEMSKINSTEIDACLSKNLYPESPPPTDKTETRFSSPREIPIERCASPLLEESNDKGYKHRMFNSVMDAGYKGTAVRRNKTEYRSYQGYKDKYAYPSKYEHLNKNEYRSESGYINYKHFKEKKRDFDYSRNDMYDRRQFRYNKESFSKKKIINSRTDIEETEFKTKSVFSRLGDKLTMDIPQIKTSTTEVIVHSTITQQYTISSKSKISSIEDVLKSPPLTESDISELLQENLVETSTPRNNNAELEKNTNRSINQNQETNKLSNFEMVRKKFALIAKGSPDVNSDNSMDNNSSSEKKQNISSSNQINSSSFADELINNIRQKEERGDIFDKLKLQDPRIQRQIQCHKNLSTFEIGSVSPGDSKSFRNNLDPRLRKIETAPNFNDNIRSEIKVPSNNNLFSSQRIWNQNECNLEQKNIYNSDLSTHSSNLNWDNTEQNHSQILGMQHQRSKTDSYDISCLSENYSTNFDENRNRDCSSYRERFDYLRFQKLRNNTDAYGDSTCFPLGHTDEQSKNKEDYSSIQNRSSMLSSFFMNSTDRAPKFNPSQEDENSSNIYYNEDRYSGISKFNAELNDKSERNKYLESKKQKYNKECSQTYAEYKRVKARAALHAAKEIVSKSSEIDDSLKNEKNSKANQEENKVKLKPDILNKTNQEEEEKEKLKPDILNKTNQEEEEKEKLKPNILNKTNQKEEHKVKLKPDILTKTNQEEEHKVKLKPDILTKTNQEEENKVKLKPDILTKTNKEEEHKVKLKPDILTKTEEEEVQLKVKSVNELSDSNFENKSEEKNEKSKQSSVNINIEQKCRKITNEEVNKLPNFQPNRLIKRRNSMVEYGSSAEVQKDVLKYANTILYADIQCQERIQNKKLSIIEKVSNRNSESLINIFKKTDDNCTVSTQNIVSGKRRTRANVNFNEVRQTQNVFRLKNPELGKAKKNSNSHTIVNNANKKIEEQTSENLPTETSNVSIEFCKTSSENGNQQVLNGVVQDILKPNANTVHIFALLESILSAEQLQKVKSIIESSHDTNDKKSDASDSSTSQKTKCNDIENTDSLLKKSVNKKRSELDRLNDDVRDMFISDGVINNTGRRICKLVVDSSEMKTNSVDENKTVKKVKKVKVKKKINSQNKAKNNSKITDNVPITNCSENGKSQIKQQFKRKLTVKIAKMKCFKKLPKESDPVEKEIEDCDVENTELLSESLKEKVDAEIQSGSGNEANENEASLKVLKLTRQEILETDRIRNTNIEWHSLSKYAEKCVVCDKKIQFLAAHYSRLHAEHYTSRLASTVVKKLQEGSLGDAILRKKRGGAYLYFHRCPLCLEYASRSIKDWIEHFIVHTCEYSYECSSCGKGATKGNVVQRHIEKHCPNGNIVKIGLPSLSERKARGYVCHLCNFVQLHRHHLNRHYVEQHEFDDEKSRTLGFEVNLINWSRTQHVPNDRADILERRAQKQKFLFILEETSELTTSEDFKKELKPIIKTETVPVSLKECQMSSIPSTVHKKDEHKSLQASDEKENCENKSVLSKCNLSNSNAFVPTSRDNDSPTTEFTQKLITIQQESNIPEDRKNKVQANESIVERLSQRLKGIEQQLKVSENSKKDEKVSKKKGNNLKKMNINVVSEHEESKNDCKVRDTEDDCWEDIESSEMNKSSSEGFESSGYKGKNKANIKKLHRFYASNANRAKKIKNSYLYKKNKGCTKDKNFLLLEDTGDTLPPPMIVPLEDLNMFNENIFLTSETSHLHDTELMHNRNDSLSHGLIENRTDFNTTVQENKFPLSHKENDGQNKINRIWNVGFSKDNYEKYKYYCLAEHCTFLYSSESVGLESHCLSDHSAVKWQGYCELCQNKEAIQSAKCYLSVVDEINHMLKFHIEKSSQRPNTSVNSFTPQSIQLEGLSGDNPITTHQTLLQEQLESIVPLELLSSNEYDSHINHQEQIINDVPTNCNTERTDQRDFSEVSFSGLQITDVRSLKRRKIIESIPGSDVALPKIVKVCSLNPSCSSFNDNDIESSYGKEGQNRIQADLAKTRPINTDKKKKPMINKTISTSLTKNDTSLVTNSDIQISLSNEPANKKSTSIEVNDFAKPLPPDSISAKAGSMRKRAPYRCMAKNCNYITNVDVSMIEHLHFHEVRCFVTERDFMRCNYCNYCADDKVSLITHINDNHLKIGEVIISSPGSADQHANVSNTNSDIVVNKNQRFNDLKEAIEGLVHGTGKNDEDLYSCIFDNCKASVSEKSFLSHVESHPRTLNQSATTIYKCKYCHLKYIKLTGLQNHLKVHGKHRYFCYLCLKTAVTRATILKHYGEDHYRITSFNVAKLFEAVTNDTGGMSSAYFVIHGSKLTAPEVKQFCNRLIAKWQSKKNSLETTLVVDEVQQLPMQPIFQNEVQCTCCAYKTKVRTNMVRHLLLHKSGAIGEQQVEVPLDPVNPMPCLNSNEKHFDKMTNLASSSIVTTNGVLDSASTIEKTHPIKINYEYVPDTKVFTCGVKGCQYLTLSEEIFRSHIMTLHSDAQTYICPFCTEEVCTHGIIIERIIHHLRLHGQYLYQCKQCSYFHYLKPVVRRHIQEKHNSANGSINLIVHDRTSQSGPTTLQTSLTKTLFSEQGNAATPPNPILSVGNTSNKLKTESRWQCNLCGQSTKTHNQIISHCNTQHGCRHRYQCSVCLFSASQIEVINKHIEAIHAGETCTVIINFHKQVDNSGVEPKDKSHATPKVTINTKPLWLRNDPQRVRHIRGILMEDEEETEQHRKRLCLDDYYDDDDDVITVE